MEHTREILTFQFGTYANYVGAHFWNQQVNNNNAIHTQLVIIYLLCINLGGELCLRSQQQ